MLVIPTDVMGLNPWSIVVWKVCAIPVLEDTISVRPIPTPKSTRPLLKVSFVMLLCGSSTTTWPIGLERANDAAAFGSETGLSRFSCGYRFWMGWENLEPVKGATDGLLDAFTTNKWYTPSCSPGI